MSGPTCHVDSKKKWSWTLTFYRRFAIDRCDRLCRRIHIGMSNHHLKILALCLEIRKNSGVIPSRRNIPGKSKIRSSYIYNVLCGDRDCWNCSLDPYALPGTLEQTNWKQKPSWRISTASLSGYMMDRNRSHWIIWSVVSCWNWWYPHRIRDNNLSIHVGSAVATAARKVGCTRWSLSKVKVLTDSTHQWFLKNHGR